MTADIQDTVEIDYEALADRMAEFHHGRLIDICKQNETPRGSGGNMNDTIEPRFTESQIRQMDGICHNILMTHKRDLRVLKKQIQDERMRNRHELIKFMNELKEKIEPQTVAWVQSEIDACIKDGGFVAKVEKIVYDRLNKVVDEWIESRKWVNRIKNLFSRGH